jgi:hypothetical protein
MLIGVAVAAAAPRPEALARAAPGLWEIGGMPGLKAPARECVGDPVELAQFEHRGKKCTRNVLSGSGTSALVEYSCTGRDFGRGKLTVLTPRSLRIETQGISDGMPFNYVLQARRVGDCPIKASAARH